MSATNAPQPHPRHRLLAHLHTIRFVNLQLAKWLGWSPDTLLGRKLADVMEPEQLEHWPVIAAFVKDPDGYLVEILETHGESPEVSGPEA